MFGVFSPQGDSFYICQLASCRKAWTRQKHVSYHCYGANRRPSGDNGGCSEKVFWQPKCHPQSSFSVIHKNVLDNSVMSFFAPFCRTLTVKNLAREDAASQWLAYKSQTELHAVVQHGNPQEIIPYAIALTSHLNQVILGAQLRCLNCCLP